MTETEQDWPRDPRWHTDKGRRAINAPVDAFLAEVLAVCERHGFSLAHEDTGGSFIVRPYSERDAWWLWAASVEPKAAP